MDLDWTTVIFEIINFGVLALLLVRFLFKPVRKVLGERKQEVERAYGEAKTARAESDAAKTEFERRRVELDTQVAAALEQAKIEGEQAARKIVEAAREATREARATLELELERARVEALERLRPEVVQLALEAGRRVLLDMHAGDIALAFARRGAERLREELGTTRARPRIDVHVSPDADVDAVSLALEHALEGAQLGMEVDPSLVGGVKLIADGLEVESSAGASLARWFAQRAELATTSRTEIGAAS